MLTILLLAFVQSMTEFLPISSSGHLFLVSACGISHHGLIMDVALHIDEAKAIITDIQIASDCLDTEIITQAENQLKGHSTKATPAFDEDNEILRDIVQLIYD